MISESLFVSESLKSFSAIDSNPWIYESLHFLYPHFNYRHRVLTPAHHFMHVTEELLFPSIINSPSTTSCPMSFRCLAFGNLDDNSHFLNCISTSINIFIFLSSTVLYKNKKEKAIKYSTVYTNAGVHADNIMSSGHALAGVSSAEMSTQNWSWRRKRISLYNKCK